MTSVERPEVGPHRPLSSTPARPAGSIRRTTTVDVPWPDFERGHGSVDLRGRDLRTADDGGTEVVEEVVLRLEVDPGSGELFAVDGVEPAVASALAGAGLRAGFGRRLAEAIPEEAVRRTLRFALLDDLPGAFLISGYAPLRDGLFGTDPAIADASLERQADVCIGWARGSGMLTFLGRERRTPVPLGPPAPALEVEDPVGWHAVSALEDRGMRRRRQVDVTPAADGTLAVTSHLRDSYAGPQHEMVLHEWLVEARVDADGRIAAITADPRTLPWAECPGAAASAADVVGTALADLPAKVRADLRGPATCTHLSSTLRAMVDVGALAARLA